MVYALILGRKGSKGFPGKNTYPVLNKPIAWYTMYQAVTHSQVKKTFLSTDDPELIAIAATLGVEIIERPPHLCTDAALGEDAYKHGYEEICRREKTKPEFLLLLFCNAPTFTHDHIDQGLAVLKNNPHIDSAITVSRYNMWSPLRARKIDNEGLLHPMIPLEALGDLEKLNCDRDSQGDAWFADVALSVIRPKNLENLAEGVLPQRWMGKNIYPIKNEAGLDIDYIWQLGQIEWWLKKFFY